MNLCTFLKLKVCASHLGTQTETKWHTRIAHASYDQTYKVGLEPNTSPVWPLLPTSLLHAQVLGKCADIHIYNSCLLGTLMNTNNQKCPHFLSVASISGTQE